MLTTLIAVAAPGVAIYSAVLARSAQKWQKARDKERRTPDVRASVEVRSQSHGVGIGELYLGGGKTIGHGDKPIVRGQVSNWPGHFFLSYEFLDEREAS